MNDGNGHQQVQQQLCQLLWLVDAAAHIIQVHGKGQDKADLCQLCGLKGKAAQLVPRVVVGIAGIVADGQRADGYVADDQRGQHQTPRQHNVHRPHLYKAAVVHAGEQQRDHDANGGSARLHHCAAVVANADDGSGHLVSSKAAALLGCPRGQRQHRHHAAENAQQQIHLIGALKILSNAIQGKHRLSSEQSAGACLRTGDKNPAYRYYTQIPAPMQCAGCDGMVKHCREA